MHLKGCPFINHKISCDLSCTSTIFLAFHNLFMILVHMEVHSKYHLLMVDSFQIRSRVYCENFFWLIGCSNQNISFMIWKLRFIVFKDVYSVYITDINLSKRSLYNFHYWKLWILIWWLFMFAYLGKNLAFCYFHYNPWKFESLLYC